MAEPSFDTHRNGIKKGPSISGPSVRIIKPWEKAHVSHSPHVVDLRDDQVIKDRIDPAVPMSSTPSFERAVIARQPMARRSPLRGIFRMETISAMMRSRIHSFNPASPESVIEPFRPKIGREVIVFSAAVFAIAVLINSPQQISRGVATVQAQKQQMVEEGIAAVANIAKSKNALEQGNLRDGIASLEKAQQSFERLRQEFVQPDSWVLRIVGFLPLTTRWHQGRDIATIGNTLSTVAARLLTAFEQYQKNPTSTADFLRRASEQTRWAAGELRQAATLSQTLADIHGGSDIGQTLALSAKGMERFAAVFEAIHRAVGGKRLKRYLVVFENSAELRPSGGFMGSFVLVDVADGVIKYQEFPKGGSYDLQGSLKVRFRPPEPLSVFRPVWQFHDANWFVDWPATARLLKIMYEHAQGPSVDGVVAITSPVIERLMAVIGPITVGGENLTAENIIDVIQRKVEVKYDRLSNSPKKYIEDVALELQKRFERLSGPQMAQLFQLLDDSIHQKLILAATDDSVLNQTLQELGALGEVRSTDGDYVLMVSANIGGEKTDRVIRRDLLIDSVVSDDGRILNNVLIRRRHTGVSGEQFYGVKNVEYVRLYVPLGSQLVRASGFVPPPRLFRAPLEPAGPAAEVQEYADRLERHPQWQVVQTSEFGKTVFGGWIELDAGATQDIELMYELPFRFTFEQSHTIMIQKQPGQVNTRVQYTFSLPQSSTILKALPEVLSSLDTPPTTAYFRAIDLDHDQLYGIISRLSTKTP